jgi:hypothetical protein
MPLFATHSGACWFFTKTRACVEETALLSLPLIYKGAKSAVMAEIDYDEFKFFYICLFAVSSKDADFFFYLVCLV